jgi:hypothetical protein
MPQPAHGEDGDRARGAKWASEHVDLDQLPSAYVVRARHLSVGGPGVLAPVGFPSSKYTHYPSLTYGLTARTQAMLGATGGERIGPGGEATFYMLGLQQVLVPEKGKVPEVSIGGYGFQGPHDAHSGGAVYLVASRQFTSQSYPHGVFAHLGVEFQGFTDHLSGSAVQPFVGANYIWRRRVRFSAEFRPRMPWEETNLYSARAVVLLSPRIGVSGGLRNNGYETHPFIGLHID